MAATLVAVLDDLMFTVKIADAAKRTGLAVKFVKAEPDALAAAGDRPAAIVLDLNCRSLDPVALASKLKASEVTKNVPLLGYISHVETERIRQAREAGVYQVLARSAFSNQLPDLLKRYSG
ncbi:MAG: response regulator [Bryobacteraceae bacterium]|nr:response regulator [Bryobacteraceae bacterium]